MILMLFGLVILLSNKVTSKIKKQLFCYLDVIKIISILIAFIVFAYLKVNFSYISRFNNFSGLLLLYLI